MVTQPRLSSFTGADKQLQVRHASSPCSTWKPTVTRSNGALQNTEKNQGLKEL